MVISEDVELPYDKQKMYKSLDHTREDLQIRPAEWYEHNGINYQLGHSVTNINNTRGAQFVVMDGEIHVEYDAVLLATGSTEVIRD